ncbi:MAG: helix-turn-helix transcriptional regulator [Planctomycetota bacterium]
MLPYVRQMSKELRRARREKGMSHTEVSRKLDCSKSTVIRMEQGNPKPGMLPYLDRLRRFIQG